MPYIQCFSCLFFSANYTTFFTSVFGCLDFRDEVYLFFFVFFLFFSLISFFFFLFRFLLLLLCRPSVMRIFFYLFCFFFISFSFLFAYHASSFYRFRSWLLGVFLFYFLLFIYFF